MIRPLAWVWMGIVIGVSFLATPVKFTADSLTRPVALDIGRATFHALASNGHWSSWLLRSSGTPPPAATTSLAGP